MNPAERMRKAAVFLARLADEAQEEMESNAYWQQNLSERGRWWGRTMRRGAGGAAGEMGAALHPITVRAITDWLHIAADYAARWPSDAQLTTPFRAQALTVADYILFDGLPCSLCEGEGADPDDQGEYNPEARQYDPSTRSACPVCNGTGQRPDHHEQGEHPMEHPTEDADLNTPQFPEHDRRLNDLLALFFATVNKHPGIPVPDLRHNLHDVTDYEFRTVESACLSTGGISKIIVNGEPRYYRSTAREQK